jgi:hypothetical protein
MFRGWGSEISIKKECSSLNVWFLVFTLRNTFKDGRWEYVLSAYGLEVYTVYCTFKDGGRGKV